MFWTGLIVGGVVGFLAGTINGYHNHMKWLEANIIKKQDELYELNKKYNESYMTWLGARNDDFSRRLQEQFGDFDLSKIFNPPEKKVIN